MGSPLLILKDKTMADIRPFNWSDEDYGVIIDISNAIFPAGLAMRRAVSTCGLMRA